MPNWVKVTLLITAVTFYLTPVSASISFVYANKYFLYAFISCFFLYVYHILFVLYQHKYIDFYGKLFFKEFSIKKRIAYIVSILWMTVLMGAFSLLAPITADFFATEFQIREYKTIKVESYAKSFRQLSKLYVVDIYNNKSNFVIKNRMLNQLNLHEGDKLITRGRSCILGFVIDNINGIERE